MKISYIEKDKELKNKEVQEALDCWCAIKNKPVSRKYYGMMRENRRALGEIHKHAKKSPWEWSWGLDYLVQFIRFMRDYYALGENVWGVEDNTWKKGVKYTRLETLNMALDYYEKWQNANDEFIKVVEHPETYKAHSNGDGTVTIDDHGFHCEYKYGPKNNRRKAMKITYKKLYKYETKYKKLFFKTVCEYMESWWD